MKTRVISALAALALLFGIYFFWQEKGLAAASSLAIMGCAFEYIRLTFKKWSSHASVGVIFFVLNAIIFASTLWFDEYAIVVAAGASVIFLASVLLTVRRSGDLQMALRLQSAGIMGFLYCSIFPGLGLRVLEREQGSLWLIAMLAIVFSGDTAAYLVGRAVGHRKLLAQVSPKKTIEGAVGGLTGSAFAGLLLSFYIFPQYPAPKMVTIALFTGLFAQSGDLFESLLKRLADVKDSGRIMPGHGGFLDRLDGVLFACPVFYILTRYFLL